MAERWRHLPRDARDTIFMLAVAAWTLLPHAWHVPWWCIAITACVITWRGVLAWQGKPLPSSAWRIALLGLALALTWWSYRTIFGKAPGVTLLVMLMVLKALEVRARRDALVMFFLGFFLVITNFFFSQSMLVAFAMVLSVWGLLTALALAHMPNGRPTIARAGGIAARAALLGMPIMMALFVLFPRIGPLWGSPEGTMAKTGLSGVLRMGGVIELINDDRIAFRVRFDGPPPPASALYFRGPVMTRFDGLEWHRARGTPSNDPRPALLRERQPDYRYDMVVEPLNLPLLPLLDGTFDTTSMRPVSQPPGSMLLASYLPSMRDDLQWATERPVDERLSLRAAAVSDIRVGPFEADADLRQHLALPPGFNPRTREWARQLLENQPELREQSALAIIAALYRHINVGFVYTLTPDTYGDDQGRHAIDEFWLDRRQGFCEHFATATVFILRSLGVPARIVTGYQGADPNPQDGWLVVRQANAHAWVEAWAPGRGWFRVDPTAAVAPERVQAGRTLRPAPGLAAGLIANIDPSLLPRLRRFYEGIEQRWNRSIVQYSRGQQYELLERVGVSHPNWEHLAYALISIVTTVALAGTLWAWWDHRRRDPWERLQSRMRERLHGLGIEAAAHDAPRGLAQRVRAELGDRGHALADALDQLDRQRYDVASRPRPDPAWWRGFNRAVKAAGA